MHDSFELIREAEARQLVVQPDEIDRIIGLYKRQALVDPYRSHATIDGSQDRQGWSEDHKCNEIMSIDQHGFVFNMGGENETYCEPGNIRTSHDTASSGTTYMATIAANCYAGSTPNQKTRRTFEFERYKGNIYIKQK